jgi:hypothetical protein
VSDNTPRNTLHSKAEFMYMRLQRAKSSRARQVGATKLAEPSSSCLVCPAKLSRPSWPSQVGPAKLD